MKPFLFVVLRFLLRLEVFLVDFLTPFGSEVMKRMRRRRFTDEGEGVRWMRVFQFLNTGPLFTSTSDRGLKVGILIVGTR